MNFYLLAVITNKVSLKIVFLYTGKVSISTPPSTPLSIKMRRALGVSQIQRLDVKFASLLDVSSVVVIPRDPGEFRVEDKNSYPCMFYDPGSGIFIEQRGIRIRLQDTFPNIRENRRLAWVCADFAKYIFMKIDENFTVRIVHRTGGNDLITRIYSKDVECLAIFGKVYEPDSPLRARRHADIIHHQMENFGEVCINDLLQNYSEWIIETRNQLLTRIQPSSL